MRARLLILAATALFVALLAGRAGAADPPGVQDPSRVQDPTKVWVPHMHDAAVYARGRTGHIAFAVETRDRTWGYHDTRVYPSASLLKPILLVAYLERSSVKDRALHSSDTSLLTPMIERSDNNAATRVLNIVGTSEERRVARRAGMKHFVPHTNPWGLSEITAADQAHFFLHIDDLLPPRHRDYGMHLLRSITSSQRWGIGRVEPPGWNVYFKGGWGSGTGWVDHQTVLLTNGRRRVALSVLTHLDGSHSYGKETLRGIFSRLLDGLGPDVQPAR